MTTKTMTPEQYRLQLKKLQLKKEVVMTYTDKVGGDKLLANNAAVTDLLTELEFIENADFADMGGKHE